MTGTLYGLGVGPGDPELLTLKGLRLLQAAPVVAYPAPLGGDSFARSIVAGWLDRGQVEIRIDVPMNPDPAGAEAAYDRAAVELARHLDAAQDVVVLCQGDPFFYGSFMYLFERLGGRYRVEIVPGVSSLTAAAAALRRPLAGRNEVLAVLPAPLPVEFLADRLAMADTAAIIKLGRHFGKIRGLLERMDLIGRARYVERATLGAERVRPLAEIAADTVPYFAMVLVDKAGSPA